MKYLLFVFATMLTINVSTAQTKNITYGPTFDEPEKGWSKILQLDNGNTAHFHFSRDHAIEVWMYDSNHKKKSYRKLTSKLWDPKKLGRGKIEAVYEVDGKPVIFLNEILDRTPHLFRIVVNNQTGAIEKEEKISSLMQYKRGAGYAMYFGGVDEAGFYVEKDPNSDAYAVINYNSFASKSDERIEVVHYDVINGEHKEISRSYYSAQGFKYIRYIGLCVQGNKNVFVCTYGFNTKATGAEGSKIIVSKLSRGNSEFEHKQIDFSKDFENSESIMRYNAGSGMIQLLTKKYAAKSKDVTYYTILMTYIDPQTLYIVKTKQLMNEYASQYATDNYNLKEEANGMPQNFIINPDNSTTIISETKGVTTIYSSRGSVRHITKLGMALITHMDEQGNEIGGFAVNKSQQARLLFDNFYLYKKEKAMWTYPVAFQPLTNNEFLSYDYVGNGKNNYVIYNEYPENMEKGVKKLKTVEAVTDASTVICSYNNGKYSRQYLFQKPEKKVNTFAFIGSSDYSEKAKTYAVLVIQREKRKKQARIAWVKLD